jgi:PAS domain S-box-containing protein
MSTIRPSRGARAASRRAGSERAAGVAAIEARADIARFFALSRELLAIADADGWFVRVNPEFERTLGYTPEELTACPFTEFIHPDDIGATMESYAGHADGHDEPGFENRYRCKDGSYRWLQWSAAAGEGGLVYAAARDVTERKQMEAEHERMEAQRNQMEAELRASEQHALEGSRLKSEFVASMSHELRTPLNGVIGLTDLLRETSLNAVQHDYVEALGASGEALLAVISDVLDFSKMEAGRLELDRTDFDLRSAVEEAIQMLAVEAHAKGLEIGHWVEANVPGAVNGDRARLRQILLNLLSNAVKFTAAGEITLRVAAIEDGGVRFSVEDTGCGIDPAMAPGLFDAFTQADQSTTREYGGTGLGLAISRRLARLMGGEIGVEPRNGHGSVFWFTAVLPQTTGHVSPTAGAGPDLRGRRTLVLDDNRTNRTILEDRLRRWGLVCESVDRPSAALELLVTAARDTQPFELAVLDFNMPKMNGVELVHQIRKLPLLRDLRIIILSSAQLDPSHVADIGVSATLIKPARPAAIRAAVTEAFADAPLTASATRPPQAVTPDRGLLILLAEDNQVNCTVAQALLTTLGLQTAIAHNGREAIEMAAAHDYDAILMDCDMPEIDGFQATRQIRKAEHGHHVPIIALTALSMPGDRERCLASGMDDYLSKPVGRTTLNAALQRWLPEPERT